MSFNEPTPEQVYERTLAEGIRQAKNRAGREGKPVLVLGDKKTVWVRLSSEGIPEGAHYYGTATSWEDWIPNDKPFGFEHR